MQKKKNRTNHILYATTTNENDFEKKIKPFSIDIEMKDNKV